MSKINIITGEKPGYTDSGVKHAVAMPEGLTTPQDQALAIINHCLAKKRAHAKDHEHNGEIFQGGAIVKTTSGKFYIAANIHVLNSKLTRNCAEANAITAALNAEGKDTQITDVWFMGGKGNPDLNIPIVEKDKGKRYCPCGSCLDAIWNHRVKGEGVPETRIHMLPLNDGTQKLIERHSHDHPLADNEVMTRSISELLPHLEKPVEDTDGRIKKTIKDGWEYINNPDTLAAISQAKQAQALEGLSHLKNDEAIKAINDLMIEKAHDLETQAKTQGMKLDKARIVVLKLDDGNYYMGTYYEGKGITGMAAAEQNAIQNAASFEVGHSVTDVFVLRVNFEKMENNLLTDWDTQPAAKLEVKFPCGGVRDRISKVGPKGSFFDAFNKEITIDSGASVHMFLLNNKKDFNAHNHVHSLPLHDLLPYRFISPKMQLSGEIASRAAGS